MIALDPDPNIYQAQLDEKLAEIQNQFSDFTLPSIEVFPSSTLHFRHRADFTIWHDRDSLHYAVFPNGRGQPPTFLKTFPIASEAINHLMAALMPNLRTSKILKQKLFQINFHSSLSGDMLVTLVYHKPLDQAWLQEAQTLGETLNVNIVGRSRKQKEVIGREYVNETFTIEDRKLHYRQPEGCFTQSNARICQDMLNWVNQILARKPTSNQDLLELYCGNGNFTLAMSFHFHKVLATELVKQLVHVARQNCEDNHIDNIEVVRMAAADVVDAISKVRPFRRLRDIDLDTYDFSTIFVDPPRCGLDPLCRNLVKSFDHILYISCNPDTLLQDLNELKQSHRIEQMAVFDQFPYTRHLECGVSLRKI